jgi:hypothetical protein
MTLPPRPSGITGGPRPCAARSTCRQRCLRITKRTTGRRQGACAVPPQLSGAQFKAWIGTLLERFGFRPEVTQASGDGGIDIVATLDRPLVGGRYLVQCTRYAPDAVVGVPAVRESAGAQLAGLYGVERCACSDEGGGRAHNVTGRRLAPCSLVAQGVRRRAHSCQCTWYEAWSSRIHPPSSAGRDLEPQPDSRSA